MQKNIKIGNKIDGKEDAMEGCWVRDHYQFKIFPCRKVSGRCVLPQDFCETFMQVSGDQEVK